MCGLCGIFHYDEGEVVEFRILAQMTDRMAHRGPDDRSLWLDGSIGLGHRRLSIIDLVGGRQPVSNEDGSVRVVFNGEIYNYKELRTELQGKGHRFRTRCDTEVLVHLYEEMGADLVQRLNGMFAFAIWDGARRTLLLARDRLGIKPMFYYAWPGGIVFASELLSLAAYPKVPCDLDSEALHLYLAYQFVPAPRTLLKGVCKLNPAEMLWVGASGAPRRWRYWSCRYEPKLRLTNEETTEALTEKLDAAVRRRLMSDVPVGAFLSGGIDSSSIVYSMRREIRGSLKTFCIGFQSLGHDERSYSREVAELLETEHYEEVLTADGWDLVDRVSAHLDEPLADASAIPTFLLARLARQHVKVSLSGDGGDELLAGYERHLASRFAGNILDRLPGRLRQQLSAVTLASLPLPKKRRGWIDLLRRLAEGAGKDPLGAQMRWQTFFPTDWRSRLYTPLLSEKTRYIDIYQTVALAYRRAVACGKLDRELAVELELYLPNDILTKLDRMTMAVSLEARVPFLDHELVEFVASLPERVKMRFGRGKTVLRWAMKDRLPERIVARRKQGFGIPIRSWLKDELYSQVREAFQNSATQDNPWLRRAGMLEMLECHRNGQADYSHPIWSLFILALWLERLKTATAAPAELTPSESWEPG